MLLYNLLSEYQTTTSPFIVTEGKFPYDSFTPIVFSHFVPFIVYPSDDLHVSVVHVALSSKSKDNVYDNIS